MVLAGAATERSHGDGCTVGIVNRRSSSGKGLLAAARVLAGLTVRDLAAEAATTPRVITQLEQRDLIRVSPRQRHGYTSAALWGRIVQALARHGVEIVPDAEPHGAGVRWVRSWQDRR